MKLYDLELSGNCYKARLFAALVGLPLEIVPVDFIGGEHKRRPLIDMNPFAEIPVLQDGDVVIRDSQAILVYLARKAGSAQWLPVDAVGEALVVQWLSTASNNVQHGPADARLVDKFGYALDKASTVATAERLHGILDRHLTSREWLELGRPTLTDIAVFPYVALAHEGGISLAPYAHIRAWIERIKRLPGFVPMPGV